MRNTDTGFQYRYEIWLEMLDEWCLKHHGITRKQAVSILFEDSPFNQKNPKQDLVVKKDLFWAENSEFYLKLSKALRGW